MNKHVKLLTTIGLALSLGVLASCDVASEAKATTIRSYIVDFFNNYLREDFTLSSGLEARGNNIIYKTDYVGAENLVEKPVDPTRKNYDFEGWFRNADGTDPWDFENDLVVKNTRLYAKWNYSQDEEEQEPEYIPPSTVLDEATEKNYIIDSIMYFKLSGDSVRLSTAAIDKLEGHKENVLPYMEYRVKANKNITATYNNNQIIVNCDGEDERVINVISDAAKYIIGNDTYESKAKKYEQNALEEESYHVMLAGSSSIEFWTTSKEDMAPIVSYNHGIGGTTIEQWDECLNQRLVYPYKPKLVTYYVGINNVINSGEDAATIWGRLFKFMNDTHEALPNTQVQYIMMNLIPGYPTFFNTINSVNSFIVEYQKSNSSWLTLINPGEALLKENGEPNAAYFRTDGLHLSNYGYVVWGGIIKQSILHGLEAM